MPDEIFLLLDDALLLAAFSGWTGSDDSFIKETSSALIHREKVIPTDKERKLFRCYDLSETDPVGVGKLLGALESDADFPSYLWEHDDIDDWAPYKDFFKKFRGSHGVEHDASTSSILLSDGNLGNSATPAELESFLFKSMGEESVSVRRLFVHHSKCDKFDSLLLKFKIALQAS